MTKPGDERRDEIMDFLRDFWRRHRTGATLREIEAALGMGRGTVTHHLEKLDDRGLIVRTPARAGIVPVIDGEPVPEPVPLIMSEWEPNGE